MLTNASFVEKDYPWKYKESNGGFFLPEVYDKLIDILYSDAIKDWKVVNDDGSDLAYPQGTVVRINDGEREKATGFLREFYDWLWTGELEAKIYEVTGVKFKPDTWMWHLDYPGFNQSWHNDLDAYPNMELTTFQIYMAKDDSKKHSGVILTDEIVDNDFDDYSQGLAQVEYKPNHAWAFTAKQNSWHAVAPIDFYRPSFIVRNFNQ